MDIRLQDPVWFAGGLALLLTAADGLAQGTFQNLDFEQANKVSVGGGLPPFFVYTADALPGWTLTVGGRVVKNLMRPPGGRNSASLPGVHV